MYNMCIVVDTIFGVAANGLHTPDYDPKRIRHRLVRFRAESVNQKMLRFFFCIEFLKHGMSYTEYMLFAFVPVGIYPTLLSFMNCVERHVLSLWVCSGIIYNRFFKRLYVRFIFFNFIDSVWYK